MWIRSSTLWSSVWVVMGSGFLLGACGDDAPPAGGSSTGSTGSTGSPGVSTTLTPDPTTPGESSTSGLQDSTSGSSSSSSSSEGPVDSTGSSTGSTTTPDDSTSSTTGGMEVCEPVPPLGDPCVIDADCVIAGDCCGCIAYNPALGAPGNCGGGCGMNVCEQIGVTDAYCDAGVCRVLGGSCDQTAVTCEVAPPACIIGELPQVSQGCYTGACIPVEHCDWVPDCSDCPADEFCVIHRTDQCDQHSCASFFPECGNGVVPTCACEGMFACHAPFGTCAEENGTLVCT